MTEIGQLHNKTKRKYVLIAIMVSMFMSAVEGTIVSTAMPGIVAELGEFSLYSWVFSSYLLMQTVTILIYGKLADLFGRKPIFIFGVIVFMIGSFLSGLSVSMKMLILSRFIQGFGAGAVQPIATTIVGDMYSKEERAKIQGYLSSVWGISSIIGPALGALFVTYLNWSYVFWMNIPLGIISIIGVSLFLHERVETKEQKIDYLGSSLVFLSISALMLVLVEGGVHWPWASLKVIGLLFIFLIGGGLFIWHQQTIDNPTMPKEIWKERVIRVSNITSLITGMILIGVSSYLPTFVQGVMEKSALIAGFSLTTMSIGWPIAATIAGRLVLRIDYRKTALTGGVFLILGSLIFFTLTPDKGPAFAAFGSFLIGVGMGLTGTTFIIAIQSHVDWNMRGIATASNLFMRSLGSTVGAAFLGGVLNGRLHKEIVASGISDGKISIDTTNQLLNESTKVTLPAKWIDVLQTGLTHGLHSVYSILVLLSVLSLIIIFRLPKRS